MSVCNSLEADRSLNTVVFTSLFLPFQTKCMRMIFFFLVLAISD